MYAVYVGTGKAPQVTLAIIWSAFFVSRVAAQHSKIEVSLIYRSQALSPQLIILRVAMGRAWSTKTSSTRTVSIAFIQNTEKNIEGKITVDHKSSGEGSGTLAASVALGKSKDTFVISGDLFTDNEVRA